MKNLAGSLVLPVVLAALASCGGGGGGGGGPVQNASPSGPPVPTVLLVLTSTNMQSVASGATLTGLDTSGAGTLLDGADAFSSGLAASQGASARALPRTHVLARFIRQQVNRLAPRLLGALTAPPCPGSATVMNNGSTITETLTACSPAPGISLDGTISITVISADPGVSFSGTVSLNLVLKQTNFPDVSISASNISVVETVNVGVATFTLSGSGITTTTGTVTEQLSDFVLMATVDGTSETDNVAFGYSNTRIGGMVKVSTPTPCVTTGDKNFPSSGVISITGAGGSQIQVTINGDESLTTSQLKIDLDANGDGTFETTANKNWADLQV